MKRVRVVTSLPIEIQDIALIGSLIFSGSDGIRVQIDPHRIDLSFTQFKLLFKARQFIKEDFAIVLDLSLIEQWNDLFWQKFSPFLEYPIDFIIIKHNGDNNFSETTEHLLLKKRKKQSSQKAEIIYSLDIDKTNKSLLEKALLSNKWLLLDKLNEQFIDYLTEKNTNFSNICCTLACEYTATDSATEHQSFYQKLLPQLIKKNLSCVFTKEYRSAQLRPQEITKDLTKLCEYLQKIAPKLEQSTIEKSLNKTIYTLALKLLQKTEYITALVIIAPQGLSKHLDEISQSLINYTNLCKPIFIISDDSQICNQANLLRWVITIKIDSVLLRSMLKNREFALQTLKRKNYLSEQQKIIVLSGYNQLKALSTIEILN